MDFRRGIGFFAAGKMKTGSAKIWGGMLRRAIIALIAVSTAGVVARQNPCGFDIVYAGIHDDTPKHTGRQTYSVDYEADTAKTSEPETPADTTADTARTALSPVIKDPKTDPAPQISTLLHPRLDTSFWQRPTGKLFKSVFFPGWGQYANKKYTKAAIFFTLETFFIAKSVQYFKKTRDRFDTFRKTEDRNDFFAYDNARKTRNKYYWYTAGTIFISMWNAYADAHLKPFEETKDIDDEYWGLDPDDQPGLSPPPLSLALTIKF